MAWPGQRSRAAAASLRRNARRQAWWVAGTLFALAAIEVLALAPVSQWPSPRIWLVEAVGTTVVAVATWLGAVTVSALLAALGRDRPRPVQVALGAVLVVVACVHLWPYRPLREVLPASLGAALLALAALGLHRVVYRLPRRLPEPPGEPVAPTLALAAAAIWINAAFSVPNVTPAAPLVVATVLLYLLAVVAITVRSGARRDLYLALVVVAALAASAAARHPRSAPVAEAERGEPVPSAPSVLLIVLDTVRTDALDLEAAGDSRTPHLARLARRADLYRDAVANASWSLPSHASLFTSLLPSRHRTDLTDEPGFGPRLPPSIPMAQELFAAAGYSTACITANPLVGPDHGLARGFDRFHGPGRAWLWSTLPIRLLYLVSPGRSLPWILRHTVGLERDATAREIVDLALAELDELAGADRPFYLFLNFMDAHAPYPVPPGRPLPVRLALLRDQILTQTGLLPFSHYARRHLEVLRASYYHQMAALDVQVGRLLASLRPRGRLDRMLVVVTSDHGEAMAENPEIPWYLGHQGAYEPAVRIPMLVKRPGQRSGATYDHRVDLVDVLPTLLVAAGIAPPAGIDGTALPGSAATVVTEWYPRPRDRTGFTLPEKRLGIYRGRFKLVVQGGDRQSLYDLRRSPFERQDLAAELPELARRMRAELEAILAAAGGPGEPTRGLDPAVEEQLRALGYLK